MRAKKKTAESLEAQDFQRFSLAAGEGFELPRGNFGLCHFIPSNAAMPWKHSIFEQSSFYHVSKGFGQSYRDKGQNKGQTWAAFQKTPPRFSGLRHIFSINYAIINYK